MEQLDQEQKQKRFVADFEKLCKVHGLTIRPTIGFKSQIDGSFTIMPGLIVVELSANESEDSIQ